MSDLSSNPPRAGVLRRMWGRLVGNPEAPELPQIDEVSKVWGLDAQGEIARIPEQRIGIPATQPEMTAVAQSIRINLAVPFTEKDQVKALGAKWDKETKSWHTTYANKATFAKWIPDLPPQMGGLPAAKETAALAPAQPAFVGQMDRVFLAVPYEERNEAKLAGAKWDKDKGAWWVRAGQVSRAEKWLPENQKAVDPVAEFADVLRRAGFQLDKDALEADGKMHRVHVEGGKGRDKKGAYALWLDGVKPSGWYINFKDGSDKATKWVSNSPAFGPGRGDEAKRDMEMRKTMETERKTQERAATATLARTIWYAAQEAPGNHPYLVRKGIDGKGLRVGIEGQAIPMPDGKGGMRDMSIKGWLISPVMTAESGVSSLQVISPEPGGGKLFMQGGQMHGGHYVLGDIEKSETFLIAEGVATAKTLQALTNMPVVVAYNAGNLREVSGLFSAMYPEHAILLAADNDHEKARETNPRTGMPKDNVGLLRAEEAALEIGSVVLAPPFRPGEKGTDWNDLAALRGAATTRSVLRGLIAEVEHALTPPARTEEREMRPFERPAQSQDELER